MAGGDAGPVAVAVPDGGIGLLDRRLLAPELAGGALTRLDPRPLADGKSYWFVRPAGEPPEPVALFEAWIAAQARIEWEEDQEKTRNEEE